jgi:hypothetical protein
VYVTVWTVALLYPIPPPEPHDGIDEVLTVRKVVAKTLHMSAYAVMALLTGWLKVPARYRWLLVFFLMAHATATEVAQRMLTDLHWVERTGRLSDVALDNVGVLAGLLAGWKWWTSEK